jgi:tRNA pseudouridine55 synthase
MAWVHFGVKWKQFASRKRSVASPSEYHGIVVVDKPAGMTSHDVVGAARRIFHTKRIGHTGTLDPDATGVLVLCLGQATRLAEYLSASQKHYIATVHFGVETDTQDASGTITAIRDASQLTEADVRAVLPKFRGTIQQIPPMVSAVHHQGKRLYELARQGVTVERDARTVHIAELELTAWTKLEKPWATLEITCSTGTYIRTLAADIGTAVGTGALMASLRRTWVGSQAYAFILDDAHTLDELRERAETHALAETVLPMAQAVRDWTQVSLTPEQTGRIGMGQFLNLEDVPLSEQCPTPLLALLDEHGRLCAVGRIEEEKLRPVKVLLES